jgi:tripartite-type tricarboxylate transporter receptor subunit TctC
VDRRKFMASCAGLSLSVNAGAAFGASGPLTKLIFPFSAGGGGDTLCRLVAQYAGQLLDRTLIVENRTGGDGLIGIKWVKNASPDGTTLLVTTGPTMYLLPMVETEPNFDLNKDFMPVSLLARFEFGVVAGASVDAKDFKQFVAWLKANPDRATFGVPSNGTIPHFTGSRLEQVLKESGVDLVADGWYGMWLPAGSSPEFASQLSAAVVTSLSKPDVREKLLAIGLIPVGTTPEGLSRELTANTALWQPIVKATGYKITN